MPGRRQCVQAAATHGCRRLRGKSAAARRSPRPRPSGAQISIEIIYLCLYLYLYIYTHLYRFVCSVNVYLCLFYTWSCAYISAQSVGRTHAHTQQHTRIPAHTPHTHTHNHAPAYPHTRPRPLAQARRPHRCQDQAEGSALVAGHHGASVQRIRIARPGPAERQTPGEYPRVP